MITNCNLWINLISNETYTWPLTFLYIEIKIKFIKNKIPIFISLNRALVEYNATAIAWYSTGGCCQKVKPPNNITRILWESSFKQFFLNANIAQDCHDCRLILATGGNYKIAIVHRLVSQYSLLAERCGSALARRISALR